MDVERGLRHWENSVCGYEFDEVVGKVKKKGGEVEGRKCVYAYTERTVYVRLTGEIKRSRTAVRKSYANTHNTRVTTPKP